jgi:hypothetical protein
LARFYPDLGAVTAIILAAFWSRHKKFKTIQKNTNPSCCVMFCDLVTMKNNKLGILQLFWKSVHKKELSRTKFYGFQAKWASYSHNHDIVCSNNPILCPCMHLGMTNNVDLGSSNFRYTKKIIFHFLSIKNGFFCEAFTKNMLQK